MHEKQAQAIETVRPAKAFSIAPSSHLELLNGFCFAPNKKQHEK